MRNGTPSYRSFLAILAFATLTLHPGNLLSVQAATILEDDFSGSENLSLDYTAPDVRPGDELWTTQASVPLDPSDARADGSIGVGPVDRINRVGASLPLAIEAGKVYRFTAKAVVHNPVSADPDGDPTDWVGISINTQSRNNLIFRDDIAFLNVDRSGEPEQKTRGGEASGSPTDIDLSKPVELGIRIDTTQTPWGVDYTVNGSTVFSGSLNPALEPDVYYIHIGKYEDADVDFDHVRVETVPATTAAAPAAIPGSDGAQPRALILSGQNNHNWRATTPQLEAHLADAGFDVTITEQPERLAPDSLAGFAVLVSNWNSVGRGKRVDTWPDPLMDAFVDYIESGGGFVVVHAGGSSFYDWAAYHEIVGATWEPGKTRHGPRHEFEVRITDTDHPITEGLAPFRIFDELWHDMGVNGDIHVLAEAFSSPDQKGSGDYEPMAFVTRFGKGRSFNLVLGHNPRAIENPGFRSLFQRGTRWAAGLPVAPAS